MHIPYRTFLEVIMLSRTLLPFRTIKERGKLDHKYPKQLQDRRQKENFSLAATRLTLGKQMWTAACQNSQGGIFHHYSGWQWEKNTIKNDLTSLPVKLKCHYTFLGITESSGI